MVNGTPTWQRLGLTVNLNLQPLISSLSNDLLEQSDDDREFKKESSSERVLATPSFLKSLKLLYIYIYILHCLAPPEVHVFAQGNGI